MTIDDKTASRLAADQKRFRKAQFARLKELGIIVNWTVRAEFAIATRQWRWADGNNINKTVYADRRYEVKAGQIVVTRTEYGYLPP
ncbi:hypothetical protein [Hyphomicrobium sp. MC1]|uniref:hypothetical protein n=1 Tax=Hyphomicrobium sp. (strain MC1) TaxID=717785 RepID=UPI000213E1B2|nr:hypothetical protein [Hyphomicrobium sp. MC1]CCB65234.1 conserved protein of unknown function [Hyphomicrobium sp. MC1]